jgi:NADH dehydrogenase
VLILALGNVTTYFGIEGLDTYSYGIKSQAEIRRLQEHLFKELSDGRDDERHYVVIGAGPTGVELAGALGEYLMVLRKHFHIRKKKLQINLIEAAPRVLPRSSDKVSKMVEKRLRSLGVHVETGKKVERETATSLIVNGKPLPTQTVIWTSGVANAAFFKDNAEHFTLNERGKVVVDKFMRAAPDIYVIGDNAATPYSGLAQTALHDGIFVARHLMGKRTPYKVISPPTVVPVGHNWAIFEWGKLHFGGFLGSLLRRASDIIGYHDVLPIGRAVSVWRSEAKYEMRVPDNINDKH